MKALIALLLLLPFTCLASLEELLGTQLVDAEGNKVELPSLQGKVIGLYFSASWCGPCKVFTPELAKLRDGNEGKFEVVLVGADRSAEKQQAYMKDYGMKWPAIPFDSPQREELGAKYGIRSIPSLVIVDDQGNLITQDGRDEMGESDSEARQALRGWRRAAGKNDGGED